MLTFPHLQTGYTVRYPTEEDIPAIVDVLYEHDLAEVGEADRYDADDIHSDWEDLDLTTDAWVFTAPDGLICGYGTLTAEAEVGRIFADGYVHPLHYGRGIGTTLIELMEARTAQLIPTMPPEIRLTLVNNIIASSEAARSLFERHGYTLQRVYFIMQIVMNEPPRPPVWPEGISVRVCDGSEEDIHRAYLTVEEGFQDHWAHTPRSYEDWRRALVREGFDPGLWFLVQDKDEIAGALLGRIREADFGWVTQVAVRRPWRKRGLGEALLRQAFNAFYQRGITRVGLGVDGQSLTGAQRLYERVGMHLIMRIGRYEKELRAGREVPEEE